MTSRSLADVKAVLRTGLTRSLASLLIKVATAGLTYLTYVVLSRSMDLDQYGNFAFGLALATLVAVAAGLGQQTAVLRFWPEDHVAGEETRALEALRAGSGLTIAASVAISLAMLAGTFLISSVFGTGDNAGHLYAAAALVLPLALAEYQSSALRAQGSVWTALAPRDLLWRVALPAAAFLLAVKGVRLSGPAALLLAASLLLGVLACQYGLAVLRGYRVAPALSGIASYWRARGRMSRWFLYGGIVDAAALNADTLLIGTLLDPASAGIYFNAFRTAGLMTLFTYAATLVIAPLLARAYHAGNLREAQAITVGSAVSGFLFALMTFAIFVAMGPWILGLFGAEYAEGAPVLIILSLGLLIDAATGSTRTTMMMTGHERSYVLIFGATTLVGLLLELAVIPAYGLIGAAVVNTSARIAAQVLISRWCIVRIGIDPSIFGVLRMNRVAGGTP